MKIGVSMI